MTGKWAMLCKLRAEPFDDPAWVWQRKWDGCRMRMDISSKGRVRLTARSGADKTAQFPELCDDGNPWDIWKPCTLDGEVISLSGLSFQEFNQRRMNRKENVLKTCRELPAQFVAFDLLAVDGHDISAWPLERRKGKLSWFQSDPFGHFALAGWDDSGVELFKEMKEEGQEGVVGKRLDEPYMPGRRAWVKVKVWVGEDGSETFWVIGWTRGTGWRENFFGSMMLGEWDAGTREFRHVGNVGTGRDRQEYWRLDTLRLSSSYIYRRMALGDRVLEGGTAGLIRVAVKYVEKTNKGSLRFPVYLGQVCCHCDGRGIVLNQFDNTEDCPVCHNRRR